MGETKSPASFARPVCGVAELKQLPQLVFGLFSVNNMADSPKPPHHHEKKDKLKEKKSKKKLVDTPSTPALPKESAAPREAIAVPKEIPVMNGEYRIDALSCPIDLVTV